MSGGERFVSRCKHRIPRSLNYEWVGMLDPQIQALHHLPLGQLHEIASKKLGRSFLCMEFVLQMREPASLPLPPASKPRMARNSCKMLWVGSVTIYSLKCQRASEQSGKQWSKQPNKQAGKQARKQASKQASKQSINDNDVQTARCYFSMLLFVQSILLLCFLLLFL